MNVNAMETPQGEARSDDDEISLLDLAIVLVKRKRLVLGLPLAAAIVSIAVALQMPNIYTGTTKVMPPQQGQSSAAAMLSQLGGLAGFAGGVAGVKNPSDVYIGMLKSRTVADKLIQRFDLVKYYETKLVSDARKALESRTVIAAGKDGIITIDVDDLDPKRAADMANAYVDELFKLTQVLAVTEASQRRLFFERQLNQAKESLARAEVMAKSAVEKGGLASIDAQGRSMIEVTARLRAQISVKEVQIGAMRSYAAEQNPQLKLAQQELAALKAELTKIEGSGKSMTGVPGEAGAGFDNLRLLRDVKYYEAIYEMLAKQFELAKIDEAKDSAVLQVMDRAIEPDRKSKPKRASFVMIATLAAGFVAVLLAFVFEALDKARQNPESSERMRTFRRYLAWRG